MHNEHLYDMQAKLAVNWKHYFSLFDLAPAGYCTLSKSSLIQEVNLATSRLLGLPRNALTQQPFTCFILPEDQDIYNRHHRQLFETEKSTASSQASSGHSSAPQTCELRMVRNNKTIWVRIEAAIRSADSPDSRLLGSINETSGGIRQTPNDTPICLLVLIDITERKLAENKLLESENRYRVLVDESSDPIFSFTPDGCYKYVNFAFAEGLGKTAQDIIGKSLWDIFPGEEAAKRFAALSQVFHTGEEKVIEVRVPRPDTCRYYLTTITPIKDGAGNVVSVICSSKNITERKKAESQLLETQLLLLQLTETQEEKIADRTRELEASNMSLMNSVTQLRKLAMELTQTEERERKQLATRIHDNVQQFLVATTMKISQLNRDNHGQHRLISESLDLLQNAIDSSRSLTADLYPPVLMDGGIVPALHWLSGLMQETHGLTVTVSGENLPDTPAPLSTVLFKGARELLFNVVKHSGVTTAAVMVSQSNTGRIKLTVSDSGHGFPTGPVTRASTTQGLGLFHLRERLKYLGGSLEICEAPHKGTCVSIEIPIEGPRDVPIDWID